VPQLLPAVRAAPTSKERAGRIAPHRHGILVACIALLMLTAAAPSPPTTEVQHVPPEQASAILGEKVLDPEGKEIGRLVDILVGQDGQPQAGVIDFGGFMGVGSRKVAVQWGSLHFAPGDPKQPITLDLTPDQIKAAPEFKDVAKPAPVVVAAPAQPDSAAPETPPPKQ
jgi:PRC-barrel domain